MQARAAQPAQADLHAGHGLLPPVRIPGQLYQQVQPSAGAAAAVTTAVEQHAAPPVVDAAAAAWASRPATSGPASFQPAQRGGAVSPPPRWSSLPHGNRPEALWQAQGSRPAVSAGGMSAGLMPQMLPFGAAGSSLTPEMVVAAQQQWPALAGQLQALAASMRGAPSGGGGSCFSGGTAGNSAGAAGPTPANTPQHAAHHPQQHAMHAAMAPLLPPAALGGFQMAGMLMPPPLPTASGHACPPAQPPPHWGGPLQAHYLGQAAGPGQSMVNPMRGGMPPMMLPPGAMGMGPMGAMGAMGMPMAAAMMGMPHPMNPYFMMAPSMAQAQMFAQQQAMMYGAAPHLQQTPSQQQQQQQHYQQQAMAAAVAAQQPQHHHPQRPQQQQQQQHQPAAAPASTGRHQKLARASGGGPCMSQCAGSTVTPSAPQTRASRGAQQTPAAATVTAQQQSKPAVASTGSAVPPPHLSATWRQLAGQEALRRAPVMRHGPGASFASDECKTGSVSVSAAATKPKASLASGSGCWDTVTQQVPLTTDPRIHA